MSRLDRTDNWAEEARLAHYSVTKLADRLAVSTSQLRRYFAAVFNQSPQYWLNELRLRDAATLISSSSKLIKEVADELHFSSPSVFCRQFRKLFGCLPSQFAARNRPGSAQLRIQETRW